jgi:hypothetical protein
MSIKEARFNVKKTKQRRRKGDRCMFNFKKTDPRGTLSYLLCKEQKEDTLNNPDGTGKFAVISLNDARVAGRKTGEVLKRI